MAISEEEFKRCMSAWPSGVTVVTSCAGDTIHGMTVSDFSGASLTPPLAVVLCDRASLTTRMISEGGCFGVSILSVEQQEISDRFASKKLEHVRFEGIEYEIGQTGAPLLTGALANLDCRLTATHEVGDHLIFVGLIESAEVRPGAPLVYWGAGYRKLEDEAD
ncbi:MAG: flavin reductase family protein [Myxococcota bacterium]|nr:flavin reductase family protein [Myxococcota bacterium]